MKKIFFLALLCLSMQWGFAQINVVAPDGNVGIGTETPGQKLDVDGDMVLRGGYFEMGANVTTGPVQLEIGGGRQGDGSTYFDLIGDASAYPDFGARLIRQANGVTRFDHFGFSQLQFRARESAPLTLITNSTERFRITQTGAVGIGISSPAALLHVNGDAAKPGSSQWTVISDARLKTGIQPYGEGLSQLVQLNPVKFRYNGKAGLKGDKEYVGLVAQEVQKIAPYMVEEFTYTDIRAGGTPDNFEEIVGGSENYLMVDPSAIQYMLINAVKEQQQQISERDRKITELERRLAELEAIVNRLKN